MMCESNWPGNILITKWNFRLKDKSKNKPTESVTSKATNDEIVEVPFTKKNLVEADQVKNSVRDEEPNHNDKPINDSDDTVQMEESRDQVVGDSTTSNDSHAAEMVHNNTITNN